MLISDNSPLRRLPDSLDPVQASFFDGIRLSAQMAGLAYTRLVENLLRLTLELNKETPGWLDAPTIFLDAWSIVDCMHRLRILLEQMPRLKKNSTGYESFKRMTAPATDFRNAIQHLPEELRKLTTTASPVWGTLSWIAFPDPTAMVARCSLMISGRLQSSSHRLPNPVGKSMRGVVDHVTLFHGALELSLSDCIQRIEPLIRSIEKCLEEQFAPALTSTSDCLVSMDVGWPEWPDIS
jgi:hypothetical protein